MKITNDYRMALAIADGLFAVQLSEGGWSIADGPGTLLTASDEINELAGYHLPVKFETAADATRAIKSGPRAAFEIKHESVWLEHALACGAVAQANYLLFK